MILIGVELSCDELRGEVSRPELLSDVLLPCGLLSCVAAYTDVVGSRV